MRIFLAGASGVIGRELVPLLVADGHEVAGTTRRAENVELIRGLGAEPVLVDAFDAGALAAAVAARSPDAILNQLTDLPDDPTDLPAVAGANARIRVVGTANLLAAARAAGGGRMLAQSVAWELPGESGEAVAALEQSVLDAAGVVLRYGRFYGPGTYYENELPPTPRVGVASAAAATVAALGKPTGIMTIVDP